MGKNNLKQDIAVYWGNWWRRRTISFVTKIKGVAITRVGLLQPHYFPVFAIGCYYAGIGDNLFSLYHLFNHFLVFYFFIYFQTYIRLFRYGTVTNTEYFNANGFNTSRCFLEVGQ